MRLANKNAALSRVQTLRRRTPSCWMNVPQCTIFQARWKIRKHAKNQHANMLNDYGGYRRKPYATWLFDRQYLWRWRQRSSRWSRRPERKTPAVSSGEGRHVLKTRRLHWYLATAHHAWAPSSKRDVPPEFPKIPLGLNTGFTPCALYTPKLRGRKYYNYVCNSQEKKIKSERDNGGLTYDL